MGQALNILTSNCVMAESDKEYGGKESEVRRTASLGKGAEGTG